MHVITALCWLNVVGFLHSLVELMKCSIFLTQISVGTAVYFSFMLQCVHALTFSPGNDLWLVSPELTSPTGLLLERMFRHARSSTACQLFLREVVLSPTYYDEKC